MNDATTHKPLRVSADGSVFPCITLPFSQLDEVVRILESHGIRHSVQENVISFNGGPEMAVIYLGRGADAAAIQAILDNVP